MTQVHQQVLRSDPDLAKKVKKLGAFNIGVCFNCGNCTAICPLSSDSTNFPRKLITYTQLGLGKKILESPDVWLCNYCGECSKTCPRQAEPAETMMALRRYAISKYNPTSIPERIYESKSFALLFMAALALIPTALILGLHGPINLQFVKMFTFLPEIWIHNVGMILGDMILLVVLLGVLREYLWISRGIPRKEISNGKPRQGFSLWFVELVKTVIKEMLVQKRLSKCDTIKNSWKQRLSTKWFNHMTVVWGFLGLLVSTMLRFVAFPTDGNVVPIYDPIRMLGTISGIFLVYGTSMMIWNRLRRTDESSEYTHFTDWIFLALLLLAGLSGFALEMMDYANLSWPVYIALSIHLVMIFELLLMAPFSKFSHAIYRPLAIWISAARHRIEI
jgi:heterodisulfide reductase subunit C